MVSIPDIEQWDVAVLQRVKDAALGAGHSLRSLNDGLGAIKTDLANWHGDAAEAWRTEHGKTMVTIDEQHRETSAVADIIDTAIDDVRWCIAELHDARELPESMGMTIAPDGSVTDPDAGKIGDQQAPHTDPAVILSELQRSTNQAVVDQMAKIRGIKKTSTTP